MTSDLIARLERLTGPCREVDYLIGEHTGAEMGLSGDAVGLGYAKFTASLDAAVALVERCLPGESVLIGWGQTSETLPWARVGLWARPDAAGATKAIALLLALFRALEAEGARDE